MKGLNFVLVSKIDSIITVWRKRLIIVYYIVWQLISVQYILIFFFQYAMSCMVWWS